MTYTLDPPSLRALAELVRRYLRLPRSLQGEDADRITPEQVVDARITAATALNGAIRYTYTLKLGHWDMTTNASTGGTWVEDDATGYAAFNAAEDMNTFTSGTGTIGTGNTSVAQSDGTIGSTSCKLKALPVGGYVAVKLRGYNGATPYFTILNAMNSAQ